MDEKTTSAPVRVGEVGEHQAADLLRAWLRGDRHPESVDLETLDDPDVADLATTLRQCTTGSRPCLDLATVRGVADLVTHAARHGVLGDVTVRAFGVLAVAVHRCDASGCVPDDVQLPTMVAHVGPKVWAVNRLSGTISRVIGWVTEVAYFGQLEDGPSFNYLPVIVEDDSPVASIADNHSGTGPVGLFTDYARAEMVASDARDEMLLRRAEYEKRKRALAAARAAEAAD